MISAEEVRGKSKYFAQIQKQKQLKLEKEQLEKIEKEIIETIEFDFTITTLMVDCLYQNNIVKLEELGFSCEAKEQQYDGSFYYYISWKEI